MPVASSAAAKVVRGLIASNRVMVFAKSYCPYCHTARQALEKSKIKHHVVDLDTRQDGGALQDALAEITGQRTVPNIFANGHHVGGCDSTLQALKDGTFAQYLDGKPGKFAAQDEAKPAAAAAAAASDDAEPKSSQA